MITTYENPNRKFQETVGPAPVDTSTPIDIASLTTPAPKLTLPAFTPSPAPDISSLILSDTAEQTRLRSEREDLTGDIAAAGDKLGTKSARKSELETAQGLPGFNRQLVELNSQIKQLQADAAAATDQSEGRQAPIFAIRGEQAQIERQRSVRAMGLSAAMSAVQGNVALANDYVERALDGEFGDLERQIDHKKYLLSLNMESFEGEEKRRAEGQMVLLDKEKQKAADAKDVRSQIYDTLIAAAQNGADNLTLNKISAAKTAEEAIRLAGDKLRKAPDTQVVEAGGRQLLINTSTGAVIQDLGDSEAALRLAADAATGTGSQIDPGQLLAYAQQYMSNGTIPTGLPKGTFGAVAQLAKELPKADGAIIDANTGTKPNMSDVKIDGLAALYDISKKVEDLKVLDTQRKHGLISGALSKTFGSEEAQRYIDLRTEIVDLLSRARTGAALTASEEKFYSDQLPARVSNILGLGASSQLRIDNFASKIKGTLDTKLAANQSVIYGYSQVDIGGQKYTVGQTVTNDAGQTGRVNPDGSITLIQ